MIKLKREVESLKTQHNDSIEWEQAQGFSKYLISTDGQVYSLKSDRLLPQGITNRGYKQVDVCNDEGNKKHMRVHRLVYMAHIGAIPEGMQINHKDENKVNNCIDNLELMTNRENCSYGTRNARISKSMKIYREKTASNGYLLMWYQNL